MNAFELKRAWGEWLNTFVWDFFGTFTFRTSRNLIGGKKRFNGFMKKIFPKAYYFVVGEQHSTRDGVHIHTLAGNVEQINHLKVMDAWNKYDGYSRIVPYDCHKGASYYLAKNITSEKAEWDFVTNGVEPTKIGDLGLVKELATAR